MLKKLLSVVRGDAPLEQADAAFTEMLKIVEEMTLDASSVYWGKRQSPEERTHLYEQDVRVNQLERTVRKNIVTHLGLASRVDVPHGLLLMSLVKDVERLGDYAKNLIEVPMRTHPEGLERKLPDDEIVGELRQIADSIENLARQAAAIYGSADREAARTLTVQGRSISKRCDQLVSKLAGSNYPAHTAVDLTLGVRFYKRIQGHFLNLLSGVLMPLHKLDYYDEKSVLDD